MLNLLEVNLAAGPCPRASLLPVICTVRFP